MIDSILFFGFSSVLILSAIVTVFSKQLVKSALCLVLTFFSAAILWMSLEAEFLGLALVLVYVGAILTLFLFVIMTLSLEPIAVLGLWKQYGISIGLAGIWLILMLYSIYQQFNQLSIVLPNSMQVQMSEQSLSNTQVLGSQLYTKYSYPLEITGVLLLIAVIASVSLTSVYEKSKSRKFISKDEQINIQRKDRVRLVKGD